jgi:predicted NAD/FAD-binding protein
MNIAIVGGGVSGLATAFYLTQHTDHHVTIFDKAEQLGGAAHTLQVQIGHTQRWVDMGVNDFNASTYHLLKQFLDDLHVPYCPLQDTTSFSTPDGSISYTIDGQWNTQAPSMITDAYNRFISEAPGDANNQAYAGWSIAQYLESKGYPPEFGRWNIFPRVNGMYFAQDTTPETMPFAGIMHYYVLQEGFGTSAVVDRQYFDGGSGLWIQALFNTLRATDRVKFVFGETVQVAASSDKVTIRTSTDQQTFDLCVLACHADIALKMLVGGVTNEMVQVLSAFDYRNSVAVAHTYAPLLPADKNAWRTYNITIHDNYQQLRPYSINYVCNLHQNDPKNPRRNHFDEPYFFVSLNPQVPIPDRYVLNTLDGKKAVAYFPHNVLTVEALQAQAQLPAVQGQNNLFFTGGWTVGAGLQEECLESARSVAQHILTGKANYELHYSLGAGDAYAPIHLRNALS